MLGGPTMPRIVSELRIPAASDHLTLTVTIDKTPDLSRESIYVAFPFLVTRPRVRYARQLGVVDPERDHLPGAGNEWICVGDWVAVTDGADGHTIAWASADAPLLAVGDIVRGRWPDRFTPSGRFLSWVMNNHWPTNSPPSQGGRLVLRYAFTPMGRFDPVRAHRMGRALRMAPLVRSTRPVDKLDRAGGPLPASGRLLPLECSPTVEAIPVSGPLDGRLTLRVRELAGRRGRVSIGEGLVLVPSHPVTGAPIGPAAPSIEVGPWQVRSCRPVSPEDPS